MAATGTLERVLDPLDAARGALFIWAQRVPLLGPLLARRDARVMAQSTLGACVLFGLTLLCPGLLYVLGPIVMGVAHVASDVRYLVLRRGHTRGLLTAVAAFSAAMLACRGAEMLWPTALPWARVELGLGWAFGLAGAAFGAASARSGGRFLLVAAPLVFCLLESQARPGLSQALFAYAHNVIALSLWALLFRRRVLFALPAVLLLALCSYLFIGGTALSWVSFAGPWGQRFVGEVLDTVPHALAPRLALGLGLSYVLLQAAHYSAWLAWIPQEDIKPEGTTTFRMSVRSMIHDFGPVGLALIVAAALVVVAASFASVHRTRSIYLSLATFHGYLEVALLSFFLARGRLPRPGDSA